MKVMDPYAEIINKLIDFAAETDAVRAVIAIGSRTRTETPADEYSDLDLIIVTREPETWFSGEIPAGFGNVRISFIEPTLGGGRERRNIYDADKDLDFIIFLDQWADSGVLEELKYCFSHYDEADCLRALQATHRLFARLAAAVAEKKEYPYPADAEVCAAEYLHLA